MSKGLKLVVAVLLMAVLAGAAYRLTTSHKTSPAPISSGTPATDSSASTAATPAQQPATDNVNAENTITYTNDGFSPQNLTVKAGTKVTIKNNSSRVLQFDSDPHPEHTDDPELNIGSISPGSSKTVTVTVTGSHGYHNHLSPGDTGALIVQ
ncbi:MAG TPA: cupredoxin domain-containing protein [Candidatus Saccharimonadales bacterium]|nr:cupredoxin domain-containing protein [Candidatus Saccharimonadales bacterium]